jgi:fumarylacetoacetase
MIELDATHDATRTSWVASANGHRDFPLQNLTLCSFSPPGKEARGGVAIGDSILDLAALADLGLAGDAARLAARAPLGDFFAAGPGPRRALRQAVFDLLAKGATPRPELLVDAADCTLHLPMSIGDFTDFYASIHHATTVGTMLRPDQPLAANYKYLPVAYTGRASSVRLSGTQLRRPSGQRKPAREPEPSFGPSRNLDFEMELGIWVGAGNELGSPIPIAEAADHIAGFCLLNDWSARDIQGWEATPLGPFLGKSFLTTISPFVVTPEALAPFRSPAFAREAGDPAMMDYLADAFDQAHGGLDIVMEAHLLTPGLAAAGLAPHLLSRSNATAMYWTVAQLLTHQASNGCDLHPGDMLGSGTLSGPTPESAGSLLELTRGGRQPIALASGETRRFLEDGDTLVLTGRAEREGFVSIGFGPCSGTVAP